MVLLLLAAVSLAAAGWRYFPGFTGDHAWYLQVAWRVSQGETLYRDVAWAYGPLPAQALAALMRWGGPDAAWASLISGLLAVTGVLLTYWATRSLLAPGLALLVTTFAALAGPNPWGGLFHTFFYVYTQAITWGSVASLAALVAALRWLSQRPAGDAWLMAAGAASGLAVLSKPEYGVVALATGFAALLVGRASPGAWARYLLAGASTVAAGFGWQMWHAGAGPVLRGYTGYDQLAAGSGWLWGTRLGNKPQLLGGYALWLAVAAVWAARRWPQGRLLFGVMGGAAGLAALAVTLSYALGGMSRVLPEDCQSFRRLAVLGSCVLPALLGRSGEGGLVWTPAQVLNVVALPWAPLLPLLLVLGWLARGRSRPAAWWVLWTFAVACSLRLLLTGYASPFAVAPTLAVAWTAVEQHWRSQPHRLRRGRRMAVALLAGWMALGLAAQWMIPNPLFNGPRAWVDTRLGPVRIPQAVVAEHEEVAAFVAAHAPAGEPLFAAGYGAQWYLLTGRANPTAFDLLIAGMGASGREAAQVQSALLAMPPAAVILPGWWPLPGTTDALPRDAREASLYLPHWWQSLQDDYVDQTPQEVKGWRVLLRRTAQER
jgi:hypothetical protein